MVIAPLIKLRTAVILGDGPVEPRLDVLDLCVGHGGRLVSAIPAWPTHSGMPRSGSTRIALAPCIRRLNTGVDPIDALVCFRVGHDAGDWEAGLPAPLDAVADMLEAGVVERFRMKTQAIESPQPHSPHR